MAGDWIKMRMDLHDEAEVIGIARRSGLDRDQVVGKLLRVWSWVSRSSRDGVIAHVTFDDVDDVAHRPGFADAMQHVGWLIRTDAGIQIPNFDRHNSKSAKDRALNTRRNQSRRADVAPLSRSRRAESATREEKRIPPKPPNGKPDGGDDVDREMAERRRQDEADRAGAVSADEYRRIRKGGAK